MNPAHQRLALWFLITAVAGVAAIGWLLSDASAAMSPPVPDPMQQERIDEHAPRHRG